MAAKSQEKIIFGVALLALIGSGTWLALQQSQLAALRKPGAAMAGKVQSAYVPVGSDAPTVSTSTWATPPAQTRGPLWIYDVFTPPEIYYNEETKEFSVTPPVHEVAVEVKAPPFGVELVQIKQDIFPLQLVGYVGNGNAAQGTFENEITGDTFLARAGKKIPALHLIIQSFNVKRNLVPTPGSMSIYDTVATAIVVNEKTGSIATLTNKSRLIKGSPIAILKATDGGQMFEQKAGTQFTIGDTKYTVDSISEDSSVVQVTKESPDSKTPVTKPLSVQTAVAPTAAPTAPKTDSVTVPLNAAPSGN